MDDEVPLERLTFTARLRRHRGLVGLGAGVVLATGAISGPDIVDHLAPPTTVHEFDLGDADHASFYLEVQSNGDLVGHVAGQSGRVTFAALVDGKRVLPRKESPSAEPPVVTNSSYASDIQLTSATVSMRAWVGNRPVASPGAVDISTQSDGTTVYTPVKNPDSREVTREAPGASYANPGAARDGGFFGW